MSIQIGCSFCRKEDDSQRDFRRVRIFDYETEPSLGLGYVNGKPALNLSICDLYEDKMEIKYCPFCGKKLET